MKKIVKEFLIFSYLLIEKYLFKKNFYEESPLSIQDTILIVKTDGIGDYLILEYVIRIARKENPEINFHLACDLSLVEMAKTSGLFTAVYGVDVIRFRRSLISRMNLVRLIGGNLYKAALCPMRSRNSLTSDSIIDFALSNCKIGFRSDGSNDSKFLNYLTDGWYSYLVEVSDSKTHELFMATEILNRCLPSKIDANSFLIHESQKSHLSNYIILCPGSSWIGKNWPEDCYVKIVNKLLLQTSKNICILGGNSEKELINCIYQKASDQKRLLCHAGDLSLLESAQMVKQSAMYIGNDTFLAHAAALGGVPTIVIVGGGHFGRFFPYPEHLSRNIHIAFHRMDCYGCKWSCYTPQIHKPCIMNVSLAEVYLIVGSLLQDEVQRRGK